MSDTAGAASISTVDAVLKPEDAKIDALDSIVMEGASVLGNGKGTETSTDSATNGEEEKSVLPADIVNVKVDAEAAGTPKSSKPSEENLSVTDAVAERLSFFLSDANLRQDFFFRKHMLQNDGDYPHMVKLDVLMQCNTIKKLTTDPKVVIAAARNLSDKLKVSNDEQAIGRVDIFTTDKMDENIPLTLHVTELPVSKDKMYKTTTQEIRELFEQYGTVTLVKFRFKRSFENKEEDDDAKRSSSYQRRDPLGSAFVEFNTVEELERAAADTLTSQNGEAVDPKRKLLLHGQKLEVMRMSDVVKKRSTKGNDENELSKGPEQSRKRDAEGNVESKPIEWKPGCVIQLKGLSSTCDREAILSAVAKCLSTDIDQVKQRKIYADYSRGQADGAIRFPDPESVTQVHKMLSSGEVDIAGDKVVDVLLLEGEAEKDYWNNFIAFKNKQKKHKAEEKNTRHKKQRRFNR